MIFLGGYIHKWHYRFVDLLWATRGLCSGAPGLRYATPRAVFWRPGVALRYTPGCVLAPLQGACGGDDWIMWIGLGELGVCAPLQGACGGDDWIMWIGLGELGVCASQGGAEGYTREVLRALVGTALLFGNP